MENTELIKTCLEFFSIQLDFLKNLLPENFSPYVDYLPIFLIAALFAFLVTPLIGILAKKYKILDHPPELRKAKLNKDDLAERHIHKRPTPLMGGLAFVIPIILILILFFNISVGIKAILIGVLILTIVGIIDDIFNLPAIFQLLGQILAAVVIALSPINMSAISIPLDGIVNLNWFETTFSFLGATALFIFPADIIMILWILICINAIKFINGSDGLMEGNAIIICFLFFVLGIRVNAEIIVLLSLVLAGGLAGFLFYNFPPAKIFSGSAGKTVLGFLIAVIAILNNTKFAVSIMILALPVIDLIFVILKRYLMHKPKSFFSLIRINDKNHLHHQLLNLGFSSKGVLLIEVSITLLIGLIAILTTGAMNLFFFVLIIFLAFAGILTIHMLVNKRKPEKPESPPKSPESKYSY